METIIRWVEQTAVYREYLAKLPEPLNNVYFDLLVLLVLTIYIVYTAITRIADRAAFAKLRRRASPGDALMGEAGAFFAGDTGDGRFAQSAQTSPQSGEGAALFLPIEAKIEDMDRQFEAFRIDREEEIARLQARLEEVQAGDTDRKLEVEAAIEELRAQIEGLKEAKARETAELKERAEEVRTDAEIEEASSNLTGKQAPACEQAAGACPAGEGSENANLVEETVGTKGAALASLAPTLDTRTVPMSLSEEPGVSEFERLLLEYEKTNALIAEIEGKGTTAESERHFSKGLCEVTGEAGIEESREKKEVESGGAAETTLPVGTKGAALASLASAQDTRTVPMSLSEPQGGKVSDEAVEKAMAMIAGCDDPRGIYDLREKEKIAAVKAGLAAGASIRQIAGLTGISRSAVQRLSKKDG